jgi:uncharacterized protein YutE (UPF0331/DUF86 family)
LNQEFKQRMVRHLNFLEEELKDYEQFKRLTREEYLSDKDKRRNVERWIENIINSTVDISKVILTIEGMSIPDTYRGIVTTISTVEGLEGAEADKLSNWVRFRNIIAHEYLDIKWDSISRFINSAGLMYRNFLRTVKQYFKNKLEESTTSDSPSIS